MRRIALFLLLLPICSAAEQTSWWDSYGDPELSRLVEKALSGNVDLAAASARIAQARAIAGIDRSRLAPEIGFTGSAQRLRGGFAQNIIRIPQSSGQQPSGAFVAPFETGLFQGGLDMKWELDFFGRNRLGLSAARAEWQAAELTREDLSITIAAEVARNYFQLRGMEELLQITRNNVKVQNELLRLTADRRDAGLATQLDVERQQVLIANTEASLPLLEADLAAHKYRLAVLLNDDDPANFQVPSSASNLNVPGTGATISSELLKRRPDIRSAEARLAAAQFRVRQARTDLFPKVNLNGLVGRQGTALNNISFGGGNFFSIGPQIQLPVFNAKRIRNQIEGERARLVEAEASYRKEVLEALEESATALTNFLRQQQREANFQQASASANQSFFLTEDLFRAGATDFLAVLDTQRSVYEADLNRSLARTQVLVESVALYKALAGSWPQ
ncbi:efflux transporter outer membrane subunit [Oscillatoria amoena NRMC-F 0135]|nr:efflux transporter outer membrane subunit [Oscillatoria amoena NRMC-F 0135]